MNPRTKARTFRTVNRVGVALLLLLGLMLTTLGDAALERGDHGR